MSVQKVEGAQQQTRRHVLTSNLRAIAAIGASALATSVMMPSKASARHLECFPTGTRIRTSDGERRVEDIAIGDTVPTVFGGALPVQWIARRRHRTSTSGRSAFNRLVRIARSALAPGVPYVDLYVTSGHALLIDGVLVTANSLINGTSVAPRSWDADEIELFQIKLATHDVIFAEGAPCETLLNVDETADNFSEYIDMYGPPAIDERHCAPVFGNGAASEIRWRCRSALSPWLGPHPMDRIRDRLDQRAIALGSALDTQAAS